MSSARQYIEQLQQFRFFACPICKRIGFDRALCASCAERLWHRREVVVRRLSRVTIRSLFSWRKDDWLGLRWWIMALKHKEQGAFWREPALWTLNCFPRPKVAPTLIPIPSLGENHALGFARELSRYTGWPIREPLRLVSYQAQKELSRERRTLRSFERVGEPLPEPSNLLIIDDIITTGATVKAAYQALQKPKNIEVWCLMDRRPCESAAPLL